MFFGNSGTGKTTIAMLYGRVLKGLGLLSDGGFELKHPSDIIGVSIDESQKKISALLEQCLGKVLIIDEAYGLLQSPSGTDAVNAIAGMIGDSHDDDIAVVLIGYDQKMCEKLIEINSSIAWRFSFERPFIFEDYTNDELGRIAIEYAASKDLIINSSAYGAFIQRCLPQFGNASTIINLMNTALEALSKRDPLSKVLLLKDFGLFVKQHDIPPTVPGRTRTFSSYTHVSDGNESSYLDHKDLFLVTLLSACLESGYDSSHEKRAELCKILTQVKNGGLFPADIATIFHSKCSIDVHSVMSQLLVHIQTILEGMENAVSAEETRSQERKRLLAEGREDENQLIESDLKQQLKTLILKRLCSAGFSWHRKGKEGWQCAGGTCYVSDDRMDDLN